MRRAAPSLAPGSGLWTPTLVSKKAFPGVSGRGVRTAERKEREGGEGDENIVCVCVWGGSAAHPRPEEARAQRGDRSLGDRSRGASAVCIGGRPGGGGGEKARRGTAAALPPARDVSLIVPVLAAPQAVHLGVDPGPAARGRAGHGGRDRGAPRGAEGGGGAAGVAGRRAEEAAGSGPPEEGEERGCGRPRQAGPAGAGGLGARGAPAEPARPWSGRRGGRLSRSAAASAWLAAPRRRRRRRRWRWLHQQRQPPAGKRVAAAAVAKKEEEEEDTRKRDPAH